MRLRLGRRLPYQSFKIPGHIKLAFNHAGRSMNALGSRLGKSLSRRTCSLLGATVALLAIGFGPTVASAGAAAAPTPEKTDIMFIFDTSGSMGGVLEEAKTEIEQVIKETSATIPNVEYGIANVEDLPGYDSGAPFEAKTETEYEEDTEKPWHLWQALTTEQTKVEEAINGLSGPEVLHDGGDGPESYGRALWETDTNPQVGWRPGARHEIVLIADNVPHTPNVNEGIPNELQFTEPFNDGVEWPNTGEELGGRWGIPDTQWKEGESLEFHKTLEKLALDGKPLAMVNYFHTGEEEKSNYIHYWEYWADQTGGQALEAKEGFSEFGSKLITIIKESTGRALPACPTGYEPRTGEEACIPVPPPAPAPISTPTKVPSSLPPVPKTIVIDEETGEIEDEIEFPEGGEAEYDGEVDEGAEAARFQTGSLVSQFSQQLAVTAKHKSKKCKKGYVKKGKKCVNNAPIPYGRVKITIPSAGKYKLKLKPSGKALAALKKGKTLNVKVTLVFTPAGTTTHILNVKVVRVHLKPKKKHHGKHHKK
jgi:hypothetical protein